MVLSSPARTTHLLCGLARLTYPPRGARGSRQGSSSLRCWGRMSRPCHQGRCAGSFRGQERSTRSDRRSLRSGRTDCTTGCRSTQTGPRTSVRCRTLAQPRPRSADTSGHRCRRSSAGTRVGLRSSPTTRVQQTSRTAVHTPSSPHTLSVQCMCSVCTTAHRAHTCTCCSCSTPCRFHSSRAAPPHSGTQACTSHHTQAGCTGAALHPPHSGTSSHRCRRCTGGSHLAPRRFRSNHAAHPSHMQACTPWKAQGYCAVPPLWHRETQDTAGLPSLCFGVLV